MSSSHYEIKRVDRPSDPSLEEAHALAAIDDPHVSTAMEIAPTESRPSLIVIERPVGETLEHRGTLAPARAVHVAIQIAHALHAAHVAGVIHRNVRPANVMLVRTAVDDAFVKLTGFGKVPKKKVKGDRFVPPEGNAKKTAGPHTDIFGVGACLDAMLGSSRLRDATLARIIARATATDPKDRFATAAELEDALRSWSSGGSTARRDKAWYVLGGLVAAGVALIASADHRPPRPSMVSEAHAASSPVHVHVPVPVPGPGPESPQEDPSVDIGPPPPEAIAAPPGPPSEAPHAVTAAVVPVKAAVAAPAPGDQAPSGSFYVDEPLRYVGAGEGETWRAATSKKITKCVEMWGVGECTALNAMELRCTFDKYGVLHCSQSGGIDKTGKRCSTPVPLEECIARASSGVAPKPKFERGDVQLAEMKYWLRRAR